MTLHGRVDDAPTTTFSSKALGHITNFIQVIERHALSHLKVTPEVFDLFESLKVQILLIWSNIIFQVLLQAKAWHDMDVWLMIILLVYLIRTWQQQLVSKSAHLQELEMFVPDNLLKGSELTAYHAHNAKRGLLQ